MNELVMKLFNVEIYIKQQGLEAVTDTKALERFCTEAIKEKQKVVEDVKSGNEKAINFLVGQVMRKSKGAASPNEVLEILKKLI